MNISLEAVYMSGGIFVAGCMWLQLYMAHQKDRRQRDKEYYEAKNERDKDMVEFRTRIEAKVGALEAKGVKTDTLETNLSERLFKTVREVIKEVREDLTKNLNEHKDEDKSNFSEIFDELKGIREDLGEIKGTIKAIKASG